MRTLIINFKNYSRILGEGSLALAATAEKAASRHGIEIAVAPPAPFLSAVASKVRIPVFAQSVDPVEGEKTTGSMLPEALAAAGCRGTLLNHSESRLELAVLSSLVRRVAKLGLRTCVCVESSSEAASVSKLEPTYVAVEPPELIGSGISVSTSKPELVTDTVKAARGSGFSGRILCGAGIVSGIDVRKGVELGVDGVLVSSSVVQAKDWQAKISELASALA